MAEHFCSACGEPHGRSGDSDELKIARIMADRDIEVARIARSEARQEIEAQVEQTEIEAEAQVAEAVVEAAVLEEVVAPPEPEAQPEPEPEPEVVEVPVDAEDDGGVPAPPETGSGKPRESSGGYWAGYSAS